MIIVCDGLFRVSGSDYEEVGPHDFWGFKLYLVNTSASPFEYAEVDMPMQLNADQVYTFDTYNNGRPVSVLLVERD